jgi:hypothetical protein
LYTPTSDYHPTALLVICSCKGCRVIGTVDFPNGFDFSKGDGLMAGKKIKGTCDKCRVEYPTHRVYDAAGRLVKSEACEGPEVEFIPYGKSSEWMIQRQREVIKNMLGIA